MDSKTNEFYEELNLLWGRLFTYNHTLMKRSEEEKLFGKESFNDIIDFYLTSQAQCFIKDFLLQHIGSPGMLFTARCFFEGIAIKRMYSQGKISDLQIELLRHQVHLIEYNYYKNFNDIADKILIPEKLEKDRNASLKFFHEKLKIDFNETQINKILGSSLPFLCDPKTNYRKLVGENLGEEYAKIYGLYSQAIHPSVNDFYANETIWKTIPDVLFLMLEEYQSLPTTDLSFSSYYFSIYSSDIAKQYESLCKQESKALADVSDVFKSYFVKNYTSDTLVTISLLISEMCSDKLLGLCEQIKSKWKILLDMLSSFYESYIESFPCEERYKLLEEHEYIQYCRNINQDFSIDNAYNLYKQIYSNGVDKINFTHGFLSNCGYTINEHGTAKSLSNIVKIFIKKFSNPQAPISWDRGLLLDYMESQMLSHANGYMWYANSGAWGDINNVIIGTDIILIFILESILAVFSTHASVEESKKYKRIINILRNSIKRIREISAEKTKVLGIPGIII